MQMLGVGLSFEVGGIRYALAATRAQSATDDALDLVAQDYFGATGLYALPRLPGETDGSYRARILASLLRSGATRAVITAAVEKVTGFPCRVTEWWRPSDTGCWGRGYWSVDTQATPFRWTGGGKFAGLAYQGFVECVLPRSQPFGNNPTPCYDQTFYFGVAGSSFLDGSAGLVGPQAVYDAINRAKVYGTIIWVKFVSPAQVFAWDQPGVTWDEPGVVWDR